LLDIRAVSGRERRNVRFAERDFEGWLAQEEVS
jgi:hypothetical protein